MRVIAIGSAVVLLVLAIFVVSPAPVAELDSKACDLLSRWAGPGTQSGQVVVVEIDEKSLDRFGRWPWPRDLEGRLTRNILEQGAATVALDIMFPEKDDGNDQAFTDAIAGKPVVVGYALRFDGGDPATLPCAVPSLPLAVAGPSGWGGAAFFHATGAICNLPAISAAASGSGFLNATSDSDGTMRHVPLVIEYGNRYYPGIALAALNLYRHIPSMQLAIERRGAWRLRLDNEVIPLEERNILRLRFRGGKNGLPSVSAADVLAGRAPEGLLRGKVAIVGGSAPGMENPVVTAVDPLFPDVEVQATAIDNLLQGDTFYRAGDARFWELIMALMAGLLSTAILARGFLWGALATLGLAVAVWVGCVLMLSVTGALFSPVPATAVLAFNLPAIALVRYLQEKKRADQSQQQLVSSSRHSREILQESESRYRRLVENVNDAIIVDDVEGRLVFANRRFHEWFGVQEGDTGNIILENYVAPEWLEKVRAHHGRRMRGEPAPDHFEFEGIRSNGTRIWIEALITTVEEGGKIVGSQAALRDTTERRRMEAKYLQAQKMESVGRLAGGVAHDFNNLLTVINGYSGMLLSRMQPEDRWRPDVEEIQKAGERAAELTQKLLAFSRKQLVRPRALSLNVLVSEAEKMFERVIGEDVELVTCLSPDLGQVIADPSQIHQVLMNLVVNARDAMPSGGKLTVETKNVESDVSRPFVYLGVTDTGTGMAEDVKRHLFEPFFTTKAEGKGTGLGLATVYGIIHQNGGKIEVASTLGQGTTFHIYLPRTQPNSQEQPESAAPAPVLQGSETVLVVEDQDAVRQFACTILERYGYRVLQASNGADAMELAQQFSSVIHLLLTDIILPVMDGRVLADKLRAVRPDTKVLYVSGYSEERIGRGKLVEGDLAYLSKPFTSEVLARRVREILGGDGFQRRAAPAE